MTLQDLQGEQFGTETAMLNLFSLLSDVRHFARQIEKWVKESLDGFPEYLVCCKLQGLTSCLKYQFSHLRAYVTYVIFLLYF